MEFSNKPTFLIAWSLCLGFLISSSTLIAQNSEKSSDDSGRIALEVYVPEQGEGLKGSAKKILEGRLKQIATKNGIGGSVANQRFILSASIAELSKDVTGTTPPIFVYNLEITMYIGDGVEGTQFSSYAMELKGTGKSEQKAYLSAIKNINPSSSKYQDFINEGKTRIIEYYNSQCDFILKTAETSARRKEYEEAILGLLAVPEVCKECFNKCSDMTVEVYQQKLENECQQRLQAAKVAKTNNDWDEAASQLSDILPDVSCFQEAASLLKEIEDHRCSEALGKAQGAWASLDVSGASKWLANVSADSKCASDAMALGNEIKKKMIEEDKRKWDFKLKKQRDATEITKSAIKAARDIGVAFGENQPQNVTHKSIF
jgi:hypothetical protein